MKIQTVIELYDPGDLYWEEPVDCCTMCVFNEAE